jgi:uncharacterized protein (TIGR02588 family)
MSQDFPQGLAGEGAGKADGRSIAEWTTLAISVAILVGIAGLIGYLHLRGAEEPPHIVAEARIDQLREQEGNYYLPIEVVNDGDQTVEDVVIEATLDSGSGEPEIAEFAITFLAGGEHVVGTFVFTSDPSTGDLTIRPVSYRTP